MLWSHQAVSMAMTEVNMYILGVQAVITHPGTYIESRSQLEVSIAPPGYIKSQPGPGAPHLVLPGSQLACLLIMVLLHTGILLDGRHIIAGGGFFDHAPRVKGGGATADRLLYDGYPAMRGAVGLSFQIRWDDLRLASVGQG